MPTLTSPMARYPHTRETGSLVFLAGQGCRDPQTNEAAGLRRDAQGRIASYDIQAQTEGVFANICRALDEVGLTPNHLVDVTVFLTTMEDFEAMNEAWNHFFMDNPNPPTRTTVAVKDLPGDNFVEMKAIASANQGPGETP